MMQMMGRKALGNVVGNCSKTLLGKGFSTIEKSLYQYH
jgi:hypothetical protein